MKKRLLYLVYSLLFFLPAIALGQAGTPVTLGTSPYVENFDNTGTAIPNGFGIVVTGTATSLGAAPTAAQIVLTPGSTTAWAATGGGFKNFASASAAGLTSASVAADQTAATNRALGVRPTGTFADGGAAFVFQVANTTGKKNFKLTFSLQNLDASITRTQLWSIDYGVGASPTSFTTATNVTGNLTTGQLTAAAAVWGNSTITVDFGSALDNVSDVVTIRIINAVSGGAGSRPSTGIDDYSLSWTTATSTTPTLTATTSPTTTPTSIDFGVATGVNGSSVKTFSLAGANLTAAATLTTAAPYSISIDGGTTYNTTATIPAATFSTAQTISVKFSPTSTAAAPGTVTIKSTGATDATVTLTGSASTPTLTASQTALTFASQAANSTSTAQTFTLSGVGLATNTTVSVPAPFAVSKDGASYSSLITYTPAELATAQTISVVFAPTAAGTPTATLTIASSGATSKTIALSGTATAATGGSGTLPNHVVMSEVYGGGGNTAAAFTNDYVELYNPTANDVTMTNWSIQYTSSTGTTWGQPTTFTPITPTILSFSGTIKSHGFFLIQLGAGTTVTNKPLPVTPDATGTINMSASAGKVALVNNSTLLTQVANPTDASIVDLLGFYYSGTAPNGFETNYVTIPSTLTSNTWSAERKATATSTAATLAVGGSEETLGNAYDTDNNANDWVGQTAPNPQASTSPLEVPPGGSATATPVLTIATTPATSPTTIDFGTTVLANGGTSVKPFTLSAANLTAGATLTTAAPYTISVDGGLTYVTTATITAATLAAPQTISVKFTPTSLTATTGSVTITSAGAIGQGVILTGTGSNVVAVPTVTATPTTVAFGTVNTTAPAVSTFSISGSTITSATTVAAIAPYTVSRDGTTYAASISYTAAELATAKTVSVKFSPTVAGPANSTITLTNPDLATSPVNVAVTGTGIAPTLTTATTPATTPTTVAFGNVTIATTSGAQPFTLTGANLTANTVLTTTAPFTLSTDGGTTYGLTATITGTLATAQTILVKYNPTALGASTGSVSITSTGAVTQTVALTGTGVAAPVPTLTITPSTLTFTSFVGTPSAVQSYTITGANLTGASTVTVAAPYSISTSATGTFGATITYNTPAQLATAQTVYVKFSPTVVAVNGVNNGIAANATAGGTTQNVTLNGTGVGVPVLTPSVSTLTFSAINNARTVQNFQLNSAYLTANAVLTATGTGYLLSKDNSTFAATLTYTPADMTAAQTVYVQFIAPATLGAANGSIAITSTGAVTQNITLNGTSLATPALSVTPATLTFIMPSSTAAATSAAQTFVLTGTNTVANTTVTVPSPYLLSKDGTAYSASLTYTPTELATAKTVYVTFSVSATSVVGTSTSTIAIASTGATNASVALTGNVVNSAPTLTAIADQSTCFSTALQTIPLAGITAGAETGQTTTVSVTSSNPAFFASLGTSPISAGASAINYVLANANVNGTTTITVTVKDNGGTANGGTDTFVRTFVLTVNPTLNLVVTSDATNNIVDKGATATLTVAGGLPGATYSWTSSDTRGIITSSTTGTSITIRPTFFATYKVTTTNACGTTVTAQLGIEVRTLAKLETSNVITPNGDGINDVWVVRNIDLYPGNIVKVYNKAGKLVYTKAGYNNDWNGTYNGTALIQGTYYYVVDLGTGLTYTGFLSIVRD